MTRRSLGEFEQLVLLAIVRIGEQAYALPIIEEIEGRTSRDVSHAAVYIALKRLEKKGLVTSRLADPSNERGGRAKRYFRVQPEALRRLRESRDDLLSMWDGVEAES